MGIWSMTMGLALYAEEGKCCQRLLYFMTGNKNGEKLMI